MPNIRVFLWVALAAILYLNYDAWMRDYQPAAAAPAASAAAAGHAEPSSLGDSVPQVQAPTAAASGAAVPQTPAAAVDAPGIAAAGAQDSGSTNLVHVKTDVLDLTIDLKGGELQQADLLKYPLHKDTPNVPVRLLNRDGADTLYVMQTGLVSGDSQAAPNHHALWSSPQSSFELGSGANELRVPLTWSDGHGFSVTKVYTFKRGWYGIDLSYDIKNESSEARSVASYAQILRHWDPASRSYFNVETYSFKGPAVWNGSKTQDLKVDNAEDSKFQESISNGWLASMQHHFVSAIVPTAGEPFKYRLEVKDRDYLLSATGPMTTIAPGASERLTEKLFVGPKLQSQLAATGPELQRTVDYGYLTVIAQPLFAFLSWVHGYIGNWGWSIILVTAAIKLLFYPLSQASGRSMAKMRSVGPRMKQIQDTYKDDREKLGRAMMDLYKKEKINPLAGCLPMVVQIPFFIAFYRVLLESVEMRQAPFMLWINDLSARDPVFVLPALMGGAMFAQFKLNPAPPDPMQAKVMQFMPLVMTATMAWFPAGLVLYWLTNTVLSIAQQMRVNHVVEAEANKPRD